MRKNCEKCGMDDENASSFGQMDFAARKRRQMFPRVFARHRFRRADCIESDGKCFPAVLPGTDFGALIASGEIDNPLSSGVESEALATAAHDYTFFRTFPLGEDLLQKKQIHLCCDVLDTLCTCMINGKQAFSSESAFVPVDEDVKAFLQPGDNTIELRFRSAYRFIEDAYKNEPLLPNPNGVNGICHIRKPGCHFGWDWGPCACLPRRGWRWKAKTARFLWSTRNCGIPMR